MNGPSSWSLSRKRGGSSIITHADLPQAAGRPCRNRGAVEDTGPLSLGPRTYYDEFSFGQGSGGYSGPAVAGPDPVERARRDNVLLMGDASSDRENYLGFGDFDFVPTRMVAANLLKTASDDWFVDVEDTPGPGMAIGRLPVRTASEADAVVDKLIARSHADGAQPWMNKAVLIADRSEGDDFSLRAALSQLAAQIDPRWNETRCFCVPVTGIRPIAFSPPRIQARPVTYIGHGSSTSGPQTIHAADARTLQNASRSRRRRAELSERLFPERLQESRRGRS